MGEWVCVPRHGAPAILTSVDIRAQFAEQDVGILELKEGKLVPPLLPDEPGVYLLRGADVDGPYGYVGESDRLRRRWYQYGNPGPSQQTNIRINELLRNELAAAQAARLSIACDLRLEIDGREVPVDLSRKAVRCLFENAWQVQLAESGYRLVNL